MAAVHGLNLRALGDLQVCMHEDRGIISQLAELRWTYWYAQVISAGLFDICSICSGLSMQIIQPRLLQGHHNHKHSRRCVYSCMSIIRTIREMIADLKIWNGSANRAIEITGQTESSYSKLTMSSLDSAGMRSSEACSISSSLLTIKLWNTSK